MTVDGNDLRHADLRDADLRDEADDFEDAAAAAFTARYGVVPL
ncbi:hypothetical protein [Microbacterium testaceum]|nr:hypothetical protein [Microbacterium testaceum]